MVNSRGAKCLLLTCFVDMKRMESKIDDVYDIETFAFSESIFKDSDDVTTCYFQCSSVHVFNSLRSMIRILLENHSYSFINCEKYNIDCELSKGYVVWRLN